MFIYQVFKVVPSTAPMYSGGVNSKLKKIATVKAVNSNYACVKASQHCKVDDDVQLFAHPIFIDRKDHIFKDVLIR